ncbi:MAG: 50S ribosomal protein L6 [Bdellovibrionales bacterium RIFOXYD1_FULL_53_11]|nr:MAG: 50S ribosomal protein L6 [Bdellovibrionales bacterium RIFOXYD1_FULL_53_11]
MSRVGKVPVRILQGVKVEVKDGVVKVEGPKGKLSYRLPLGVDVMVKDGSILVTRDEAKAENAAALHGMTRTMIQNMVHGAHVGFTRELDIVGVGFKAATKGSTLTLMVGYSHPIEYEMPTGITAKVENNTHIVLSGADKMQVGMVAAKVRSFREPEPYQGKGIRYTNEHIIRKQGKAAAGAKTSA